MSIVGNAKNVEIKKRYGRTRDSFWICHKNLKEKFGGEKQACRKNFMPSAKGRKTGIFTTWDECRAQVHGFPMCGI